MEGKSFPVLVVVAPAPDAVDSMREGKKRLMAAVMTQILLDYL
jgi:hypothetical protein